jgi:hypothetical protein
MHDNPIMRARLQVMAFNHALFLRSVGEDLSPSQSTKPLVAGGAHILWLVGHMAWTYDVVMRSALNGEPSLLPSNWPALFGQGSKPTPDPAAYPPLAEVLLELEKTHAASMAYLATIPDGKLPENLPPDHPGKLSRTWDRLILAACFHESYHAGQAALLRRGLGLPGSFR